VNVIVIAIVSALPGLDTSSLGVHLLRKYNVNYKYQHMDLKQDKFPTARKHQALFFQGIAWPFAS
jgi:hypothetical protein